VRSHGRLRAKPPGRPDRTAAFSSDSLVQTHSHSPEKRDDRAGFGVGLRAGSSERNMLSNRFVSASEVNVPDPGGDFWARRRSSVLSVFLWKKGSDGVGKVRDLEAAMLHMNVSMDRSVEIFLTMVDAGYDVIIDAMRNNS